MLLMTPVLEAQNTSVSLWEENIEQLSLDEEEKNWEDELEELSDRLHEPVNINVTTCLLYTSKTHYFGKTRCRYHR